MADISAYQHKFRAVSDRGDLSNKVNKRNRQPLSCLPCRTRKLKCDRGQPCDSCVKRDDASACSYSGASSQNRTKYESSGDKNRAQERLQHLEGLVMQMMNSNSLDKSKPVVAAPPTNGITFHQNDDLVGGLVQGDGIEPSYVGGTHWAAILNNIQELKTEVGSMQSPPDDDYAENGLHESQKESLFNIGKPTSIEEILQYLPPRQIVDRRLSTYFKAKYAIVPIIHAQQFQRMYEAFWKAPTKAPLMWLAQLFAICCMSAQLSEAIGSEPSTSEGIPPASDVFQSACAQCLALGDFATPQRHVVEALLLYCQCKYRSTQDPAGEVWVLFGVIARLAFQMGYHRDPKHFPFLSVFEGEMRRRTWAIIRHLDLMNSFQMGLPSIIQTGQYDTVLPGNLHDLDFDESSTELPPSRPDTDPDLINYFITKAKMMTVFEQILNQELSTRSVSYEKTMELDKDLRQVHASIPLIFKIKPMSESFFDPTHIMMARLNLELLFRKAICVLHRKYLSQNKLMPYSRNVCADAAMEILKLQAAVHQEVQPGGQLHQDRWMLSSFTFNDFFLAAIVLCLDVLTTQQTGRSAEDEQIQTKLNMIHRSYMIVGEQTAQSKEARRVTEALAIMLTKLKPDFANTNGSTTTIPPSVNNNGILPTPPTSIEDNRETEFLGQFSGPATTATVMFDPIENMISGPEQVDWAFLDQYLLDGSTNANIDPTWPDATFVLGANPQTDTFMQF